MVRQLTHNPYFLIFFLHCTEERSNANLLIILLLYMYRENSDRKTCIRKFVFYGTLLVPETLQ